MTETTTPVEEQTAAIQAGDLGKQLIACREKAGLDLEQAADEMHLSPSLLRSLEKEEFARLPEPPYVRGYLRGYAKFSDTDPKELIRTYEALRGANPDEIAHHFAPSRSLHRVAQQPAISPTIIKLLGVGVIVLGLGILSLLPSVRDWTSSTWAAFSAKTAPSPVVRPAPALEAFTAQKDAEEQAAIATSVASATPDTLASTSSDASAVASTLETAAPTADAAATTTPVPEGATTTPTASTDSTATTKPSDAATATTSGTAPTTVATASSTQDTATTAPTDSTTASTAPPAVTTTTDASATPSTPATATGDATTTTATAPATTPDAAAATTADATTPTQPIAGEVNIKLEFTQEVWMQIKDDGKKTLYESLNAAGSTKELKATTPLNFKVGNAHGVKIYLNGQLYDQAPHTKGSVSRFKVE